MSSPSPIRLSHCSRIKWSSVKKLGDNPTKKFVLKWDYFYFFLILLGLVIENLSWPFSWRVSSVTYHSLHAGVWQCGMAVGMTPYSALWSKSWVYWAVMKSFCNRSLKTGAYLCAPMLVMTGLRNKMLHKIHLAKLWPVFTYLTQSSFSFSKLAELLAHNQVPFFSSVLIGVLDRYYLLVWFKQYVRLL